MGKKLSPVLLRKNPNCESSRKIFHHASKFFSGLGCWRGIFGFMESLNSHMVPAYMDSTLSWNHYAEHGTHSKSGGFSTSYSNSQVHRPWYWTAIYRHAPLRVLSRNSSRSTDGLCHRNRFSCLLPWRNCV